MKTTDGSALHPQALAWALLSLLIWLPLLLIAAQDRWSQQGRGRSPSGRPAAEAATGRSQPPSLRDLTAAERPPATLPGRDPGPLPWPPVPPLQRLPASPPPMPLAATPLLPGPLPAVPATGSIPDPTDPRRWRQPGSGSGPANTGSELLPRAPLPRLQPAPQGLRPDPPGRPAAPGRAVQLGGGLGLADLPQASSAAAAEAPLPALQPAPAAPLAP